MIIDVWSDVVCPWCFIGKKRLEKALEGFEHKEHVTIRHRAFQLQPDAAQTLPTKELLATKYRISEAEVSAMQANVCAIADGEGLCYNLEDTLSGNTFDAHRLLLWAQTIGVQDALLTAMYSGYFENSKAVFTHQDLCDIAQSVGISPVDAMNILESAQFSEEVIADRNLAEQLGATGVPFFVIDMKYGISGAQPLQNFVEIINAAWSERA
jgi:predicted DsbA family dithiol-disulfide isomerase